jgi:hypothetical protein
MRGFWRLVLQLIGLCLHDHRYRAYRGPVGSEVLSLVCDVCGHSVPAIARSAGWVPGGTVPSKAVKAPKAGKVTQMRRAR